MTSGAADSILIDTNVLVYATERRAPLHQVALNKLRELYRTGIEPWASRQVLREYLATLTRPQIWGNPQPIATLLREVRYFEQRFTIAEDNADVTARLLALLQQISLGGKQVHDANIVATMLTYNVPRLLTNNTGDFARFAGIITVEPLMATT